MVSCLAVPCTVKVRLDIGDLQLVPGLKEVHQPQKLCYHEGVPGATFPSHPLVVS